MPQWRKAQRGCRRAFVVPAARSCLPSLGGGGSARIARCVTGWGDLSTRALFETRDFHPTPPLIAFASTLPLQGRVSKIPSLNFPIQISNSRKIPAALIRPSCASSHPRKRQRAQGRPGARCTRGLACKSGNKNAHEHTGSAETLRPSLRSGFTAYFALSPVTGLSCHRHWRNRSFRQLDTSVGVSGPHDFAVRVSAARLARAAASTASRPALVTLANAPLCGTGCAKCAADLGVRAIPTGCDISTRRANQQLARLGTVKRNVFRKPSSTAVSDLPVGQINAGSRSTTGASEPSPMQRAQSATCKPPLYLR
jgi:hypothetical protein